MKITEIKPNENNPRFIADAKFEKLKKSIESFPQMMALRPIVVDTDGIILGGNMRLRALQDLGYKEIPDEWVKRADELTEEQKREFIIKDNVGFGQWEWDMLANEWDSEQLSEWGLDVPDEWGQEEEAEVAEDDYEEPDNLQVDVVLGDLIEIGEHRLLCGDSTQTDSFEKLMQGELGDMVVTDPPYNVNYEGKTKDALKIKNDSMSSDSFYQFLYDFYTACSTACKKGAAIYVWHASGEMVNFASAMIDAGWLLKQQLIWVKNSMVMGRQDYQWKHEPCLYGWLDGGSHKWYSDRKQTTVIEWQRPNRNGEHPTMKPVGLFGYQIQNSSKKGDVVVDPFGGSGTTIVSCEELGRKARIIEYDPKYCQVIIDRMHKLDPSLPIKINGKDYTPPKQDD